jgi:voltage-gated potassium channel
MLRPQAPTASPGYQVFMLVLCLYSLGVLAYRASQPSDPATVAILDYADFTVCMIFLGDFLISLFRAKDRWAYFRTWGWLDLLSSIPTVDLVRWGRVGRVFRILRVFRGLRATQLLASLAIRRRAENSMLAASLVALMLITFCSIAILQFETGPDANILSADDAVWWALTTITTVGYGDRYPTTGEGRMVAVLLMSAGVGLFGVFSAFLASRFIGEEVQTENAELVEIRSELVRIRELLEQRDATGS